jgi:acetyl-CoA carboxylase biotin carboxyl carrier protein
VLFRSQSIEIATPKVSSVSQEAAIKMEIEEEAQRLITVTSPIVGTFYRSPSPEAAIFVETGRQVKKGQVLCIIEAMKLMNEIESEVDGILMKALVDNGQPVEYGEPLFLIEPV